MAQNSWILTAFEPFAGRTSNLSAMVLDDVSDSRITTKMLPVVFAALGAEITTLLDQKPSALIFMGESTAHSEVRVESVALNLIDAGGRPDNRGSEPNSQPVVTAAPLALWATWNANAVVRTLGEHRVPAKRSHHAGVYACNQALYLALHLAAERDMDVTVGFLHVPRRGLFLRRKARRIAAAIPDVFQCASMAT